MKMRLYYERTRTYEKQIIIYIADFPKYKNKFANFAFKILYFI